jgi:hypothetical protein
MLGGKVFLKRVLAICFFVTFLYFVFPSFAHAYLDPGTGSYIFQLIMAGIVGLLFALKIYWKRIKSFFTGLFSRDSEAAGSESGGGEQDT